MTASHPAHAPETLSRNQAQILSCLREANEPLSAYAILDRVKPSGISHPPTVYRALNELMQKGMVHRIESRSAFVACDHGVCEGRFAFASCRGCGKVIEVPLSPKQRTALLRLVPDDMAVDQMMLEFSGLCSACRA